MDENNFINFRDGQKFLDKHYLSILKKFKNEDLPGFLACINRYYEQKNLTELGRACHSLKMISLYLGASNSKILAENLQILCQNPFESNENLAKAVSGLNTHLIELDQYLFNYFSKEPWDSSPNIDDNCFNKIFVKKKIISPVTRILPNENIPIDEDDDDLKIFEKINQQYQCFLY